MVQRLLAQGAVRTAASRLAKTSAAERHRAPPIPQCCCGWSLGATNAMPHVSGQARRFTPAQATRQGRGRGRTMTVRQYYPQLAAQNLRSGTSGGFVSKLSDEPCARQVWTERWKRKTQVLNSYKSAWRSRFHRSVTNDGGASQGPGPCPDPTSAPDLT